MLELRNIKKDYALKDQEPVHALKGISLNFRANEFVAILGHSGCGKTTLLNITGGLDHYDSGDLIIKGVSTKDFKDNDWDTYRNHSIGFVFQTYNLIPHQTILRNVELALTISGIKKEERVKRAKEALDKVGLAGLYSKKPNQMSGGQMQRVAIARALVNNPEIVLADEPTGALDSETSIQIMDLLKEVAKDHLVIMVTHNPELAEKYATRIVRMKDGLITDDSNPYDGQQVVEKPQEAASKGKKQSAMSFFTATNLSLSNLWSKFRRTLLVAIAGSIGIIGVSTILGVSCGVNDYIVNMEDDMLSSYPIGIAEEAVDLSSLLSGLSNQEKAELAKFDTSTQVGMDSMIEYLLTRYKDLTSIETNEITQELVDYISEMPQSYYSAINYNYSIDPTNNFFTSFKKKADGESEVISTNGLTQQYIKTLMTVKGFSNYAQFVDLFTAFMKQLPAEKDYILSQYDLLGNSRFPEKENELLLVVDGKTTLTDLVLAQLGYYPQDEFLNVAKKAVIGHEIETQIEELKKQVPIDEQKIKELEEELAHLDEKYPYNTVFSYDEILNHDFYYFPHDVIYKQNPTLVSHKDISANLSGTTISGGNYYLALKCAPGSDNLTGNAIEVNGTEAKMHNVIASRLDPRQSDPSKSELEGRWFMVNSDEITTEDMEFIADVSRKGIDSLTPQEIIAHLDTINKINLLTFTTSNPHAVIVDGNPKERTVEYDVTCTIHKVLDLVNPWATLNNGAVVELDPATPDYYYESVMEDAAILSDPQYKVKVVGILRAKPTTNFGTLSRGVYYTKDFAKKYRTESNTSQITTSFKEHIMNMRYKESQFNAYVQFEYDDYSKDDGSETFVPETKRGYANALNGDQSSTIASIFASFLNSGTDNLKNDKLHLRALAGLRVNDITDDDQIVIGHEIKELPQSISIYPKDFTTKNGVTSYLDKWNSDVTLTIKGVDVPKEERSEITYTDTISMIITVISTLVTTISAALIAFTSLSLVVSCFMIAVITYISVMERVKEIGVIRSLGGRKKDVSRLFIAENLITGLSSGVIGIGITYVLQIIINMIVKIFDVPAIAALPWYYALMMIGIAILLSVLSGLIPSLGASKQDPVVALRSE